MRRFAASALDRSRLSRVLFYLERGSTAASRDNVGVVDLEPRALQAFHVVDLGAEDELHADLVDEHGNAIDLEDVIVVLGFVEGERVLEARAATAADGNPQSLLAALGLAAKQLANFLGGLGTEGDRCVGRVVHFTKCSLAQAAVRAGARLAESPR